MEDVIDIVLNLKQVRLKNKVEGYTSEKVSIVISGQDTFTAGDMNRYLNYFQVLNPELLICRMEPTVRLNMEITIDKGRGYVPVEDNRQLHDGIDVIAVDSTHTPIRNVKYTIEPYRVEQKTDFEKLIIEVDTDGSIHPKDAIQEAAKILIQHFALLSDENIALESQDQVESQEVTEDSEKNIRQILQAKLIDMDLSVRALNCLKSAELETLGDLVAFHKADLLKFRNFGKKSLAELEELVHNKGLEFGMNVEKYNIDNE
jgi:DNA-directed RNA polymerase subunit alpha